MAGFNVKAILGIAPLQQSSPRVPQMTTARRSEKTLREEAAQGDKEGALALGAAYTTVTQNRKTYLRQFEDFKNFYLVDAILSGIIDDALSPDITTGKILDINSEKPEVNKKLKELASRINFDSLVSEIAADLVGNGEYSLKTTVLPGKGVVEVADTVDQSEIVALYDHGVPSSFLVSVGNDIAVRKASEYAHFYVGHFRVRIPLTLLYSTERLQSKARKLNVPPYARFGKPLFYGTLSKIKELQLLENLVPSAKLSELTRGSIVGVSLPPALDPKSAFSMCREYEQVFNSSTGLNRSSQDLSISDIIAVAGRVKVMPMFGEKGSLQSLSDIRNNRSIDDLLNSVNDIRAIVCTSIGYPPELLFAGTEKKGELLKRYSRYLRKLKAVQTAIANGVKQICLMHLVNLEMPAEGQPTEDIKKKIRSYTLEDIDVSFRNKLVNVDELEKLEFADAMVSTVKQTFEFITGLSENEDFKDVMNKEAVVQWLNKMLTLISPTDDFIIDPTDIKDSDRKDM